MKLFCNCNSKWITSLSPNASRQLVGPETRTGHTLGGCPTCGLRYWIEADYENMMHDLKSMNT